MLKHYITVGQYRAAEDSSVIWQPRKRALEIPDPNRAKAAGINQAADDSSLVWKQERGGEAREASARDS